MKKKILFGILGILVLIQFFQINKNAEPVNTSQELFQTVVADEEIKKLLKDACFNCHSYQTKYPWYSYVQPVGWWLRSHVRGARQKLNFSEWTTYSVEKQSHKMEECIEEVREKQMPLRSFIWMHPEAKLSTEERQQLIDWFINSNPQQTG